MAPVPMPAAPASPSAAWQALAAGAPDDFIFVKPWHAQASHDLCTVAADLAARGSLAAVGSVRDAEGRVRHTGARADAFRYAHSVPGSLMVSARLAGSVASRLVGRDWDDYWASDLAAAVAELCEPTRLRNVFCQSDDPVPACTLLPLSRAGARAFDPSAPTVVVYGASDASALLYFDAFSRCAGLNLRFLRPSAPMADLPWLVAASAVIIVRNLEPHSRSGLMDVLDLVGVPLFWFVDDDFVSLAEDGVASFAFYQGPGFSQATPLLDGVIASTPQLAAGLGHRMPDGPPVTVLPPRLASHWPIRTAPGTGIGLIGGAFRGGELESEFLPALGQLPPPVRIVASDNLRPFLDTPAVEWEPFEADFLTFLHRWLQRAPAILLHPPGRTRNLPNKSNATLLVAHALSAVPIVADEPAFAGWGEEQGVLRLEPGNWTAALNRGSDPEMAADLRRRLALALGPEHLSPPGARDLLALLDFPSPVDALAMQERLIRALADPALTGGPAVGRTARPRLARRPRWRRIADAIKRRLLAI